MLDEGWRRHERGTDVVVGFVETHRPAQDRGPDPRPRGRAAARRSTTAARRSRRWTSTPCSPAPRSRPRRRDGPHQRARQPQREALAGHRGAARRRHRRDLDGQRPAPRERSTTSSSASPAIQQRETVPDAVVRRADQIELVDMSPEALRRRMAHGNIYPAERVDAALANYFRPGNLAALRELALLWVADRVEDSLQDYMDAHGISDSWETRSGSSWPSPACPAASSSCAAPPAWRPPARRPRRRPRRALRRPAPRPARSSRQRRLLEELGGIYREVVGEESPWRWPSSPAPRRRPSSCSAPAAAAAATSCSRARSSTRSCATPEASTSTSSPPRREERRRERRAAPPLAHAAGARRRPRRRVAARGWLARRRRAAPAHVRSSRRCRDSCRSPPTSCSSSPSWSSSPPRRLVVGAAAAVAASLLVNWFFVPPVHTFTIGEPENLAAARVFVAIAVGAASRRPHRTAAGTRCGPAPRPRRWPAPRRR